MRGWFECGGGSAFFLSSSYSAVRLTGRHVEGVSELRTGYLGEGRASGICRKRPKYRLVLGIGTPVCNSPCTLTSREEVELDRSSIIRRRSVSVV